MKKLKKWPVLPALLLPFCALAQDTIPIRDTVVKSVQLKSVTVGNQEDIAAAAQRKQRENLQIPTDRILERIPGIQMIRRGNFAWEPTMRSLNAGQINVTLDGMHIFGACTDRMDPVSSYVETTNLNRIVTNFGPGFENYGGGIGGGIDFKPSDALPGAVNKISAMLGSGYETTARASQAFGSVQYSAKRFAIAGNAMYRRAGNYKAGDGVYIPFSQYNKWNVSLSTTYKIDKKNSIAASYIQDEGWNMGYPALTMDVAYAKAKIASVTYHYHPQGKKLAHLKTKLYYNLINHTMDDTKRLPEQVKMHMEMPGRSWTGGFYSETMYVPNTRHALKGRISGYMNRASADMTMYPQEASPMYMYTLPDAQRLYLGIDLADYISLGRRLSLNINTTLSLLHSSLYSQSGKEQVSGILNGDPTRMNFLGNIGTALIWQSSKHWTLSAKAAFTSRAASLQEYYAFYIYNRLDAYDYLGNAKLRPERSINMDVRAVFDRDWFRVETSVFSYFFSDYIVGRVLPDFDVMTIGGNGVKQYMNIRNATLYGGEAILQIKFGPHIRFTSTNTYTLGSDADGSALPLVAPYSMVNGIQADIKGYFAFFELETAMAQNHVSTKLYGETATPSSTVVNLGLHKSYKIKNLEVLASVRVENLFDTFYYRHLDIRKIGRQGRSLSISLTFRI